MKDIIKPVDTDDGLFHDGDPSTGIEGTIVDARIMNAIQSGLMSIQRELLGILQVGTIKPDESKNDQIVNALNQLFIRRKDPFSDIASDGPEAIAHALANLGLGTAAKSSVVQATGQSEKDVISQKGATDIFALKSLFDHFGAATLMLSGSRDYSLQLSDAGILSLYSKALDKTVMAWSAAGELIAGSVGIAHLTGLGAAAQSDVAQATGQSDKNVMSQKAATDNFVSKTLLDNFGGATLLFNKSKDYSLQLSDAGALSLYSKALDKTVLAFSPSGELQAGTIGFEHVKELKSAAKRDVGNSAGQIPDMGYFELSGIGTDNMIAKFPNGLIIQVFRRNISNSASVGVATINPVTFPTPFPGAVWGVFCTKTTYAQINTSCESVTNTGFSATTCAVSGVGSTTSSSAVFLAIGYA